MYQCALTYTYVYEYVLISRSTLWIHVHLLTTYPPVHTYIYCMSFLHKLQVSILYSLYHRVICFYDERGFARFITENTKVI